MTAELIPEYEEFIERYLRKHPNMTREELETHAETSIIRAYYRRKADEAEEVRSKTQERPEKKDEA